MEQAFEIAKAEVAKRENWPQNEIGADGFTHSVAYNPGRINNGGWEVVAHKGFSAKGHGCFAFDPVPPVRIIINKRGAVTHYVRDAR